MKKIFLLLPVLAFLAVACGETATTAPDLMEPELGALVDGYKASSNENEFVYTWDGQGTDSEACYKVGEGEEGQRPETGWMHWLFNNKGASEEATLILSRNGAALGEFEPQAPLDANNWHFYTPYFPIFDEEDPELRTLEAKVVLDGEGANPKNLILSDYCPGAYEELDVEKTAVTFYTREHYWDIDKKVETEYGHELDGYPKIWLYADGSGDEAATWTVDVTYEGYEDSGWNVSGEITIENTGTLDAVITAVDDVLASTPITVDCGEGFELPYTLPVGESLTCYYDEDGYVEGFNEVTVITERDEYFADAEIIWGEPDEEINETVNIKDVSDLFGEVDLGTVTAPNGDTFTYDKDFAWEDYGADLCGSYTYDNTATIVETGQDADATLKVNVPCPSYIYETAYAKGDAAICFIPHFANWGWTNPIEPGEYEWDLWAGAAHCDTEKGIWVGTVTVEYGEDGSLEVTFNVDSPYFLEEYHVYAGTTEFPQMRQGPRTVYTVAPGQYYIEDDLEGDIYVIVHAVVGMPDPDFDPEG